MDLEGHRKSIEEVDLRCRILSHATNFDTIGSWVSVNYTVSRVLIELLTPQFVPFVRDMFNCNKSNLPSSKTFKTAILNTL